VEPIEAMCKAMQQKSLQSGVAGQDFHPVAGSRVAVEDDAEIFDDGFEHRCSPMSTTHIVITRRGLRRGSFPYLKRPLKNRLLKKRNSS
jgi:hypothetical protein